MVSTVPGTPCLEYDFMKLFNVSGPYVMHFAPQVPLSGPPVKKAISASPKEVLTLSSISLTKFVYPPLITFMNWERSNLL